MRLGNEEAWDTLHHTVINCRRCPRLVAWREEVAREKRRAYRDWDYWGRPVPGFGDRLGRLLIIGLAPGAHGSNRTGRMFTGDSSGETLFGALYRAGFANQPTGTHLGDGLALADVYITAVARCVPPQNRPHRSELDACREYLVEELQLLTRLRAVLVLGRIAFDEYRRTLAELGHDLPRLDFVHGACYELGPDLPALLVSYHPSRQNTQTGRLTQEMFDAVFARVRRLLAEGE